MSLVELRAFLQGCIPAWGQDLVSSTLTMGVGADKAEGVNMVTPRSPFLGGACDSTALSLAAVPPPLPSPSCWTCSSPPGNTTSSPGPQAFGGQCWGLNVSPKFLW